MSTTTVNEPALPYSPKDVKELHDAMRRVNEDMDAGAFCVIKAKATSGRRGRRLATGAVEFYARGLEIAERLLATLRQRDAHIERLEEAYKKMWVAESGGGDDDDARVADMLAKLRGM